jgi:hypothetical protein
MSSEQEIQRIVKQVQSRLDARRGATGLSLKVPKGGYREDDEWLHVIVAPVKNGVRAYDYVEALGEIESDLRDSGIDHVLLVPAMAD